MRCDAMRIENIRTNDFAEVHGPLVVELLQLRLDVCLVPQHLAQLHGWVVGWGPGTFHFRGAGVVLVYWLIC